MEPGEEPAPKVEEETADAPAPQAAAPAEPLPAPEPAGAAAISVAPPPAPAALPLPAAPPQNGAPAAIAIGQPPAAPAMPPMQQPPRALPPVGAGSALGPAPGLMGQPPMNNAAPPMMASESLMPPAAGPMPGNMPMATGAPAGQPQPYRQLKVEDALAYLDQVKMKFEQQPHIYNQFLDIMKEFKAQSIDTPGVIDRVLQLFHGHRELILGFNTFLPPGYKIEFSDDENKPRVQLKYPQGMTGPQPQGFAAMNQQPPPAHGMMPQQNLAPAMPAPMAAMGGGFPGMAPAGHPEPPGPPPAQPAQKKAPIEFDQAINYVTKIKTRFAKQPETYKAFLEILHTYQKEQKTIKEVYEQVSTLFKNHTDLLGEFSQFLPDGSSPDGGASILHSKSGKGKGMGGSFGMGGGLKQPVAQRPSAKGGVGGAGRAADDDEERYWQKRKQQGHKEGAKRLIEPAARSPEAEFFSKCRNRMPKPLYLELLKCLNLYSQQIVDRSELLTLVHDLFKRSQIDLFGTFRRLLGYSGGVDRTDAPSPPAASQNPVAECGNYKDLDFNAMRRHGTSYRILPDSYAMPPCSGRGPLETLVLNDSWVSVATGTEDINFKTMRKNQYEESIFRAEDERFEMDTTIETNMATLQMLQPIAAEIAALTEPEKRRYKLPQPLSAMHSKSIRRLYGAQGAQVIELLQKCPAAAVSALLKRLQQKDDEWRTLRTQCSKAWKDVYEKNYTKSLDHRSFYFKQGDKKNFSGKAVVQELKALVEADDKEKAEASAAAAANEGGAKAEGAGLEGCLQLPFTLDQSVQAMHDGTLELMTFAAKLSFSVVEGEIDERMQTFWDTFVRRFFVCPELEPEGAGGAAPMETDGGDGGGARAKPLLIVAADASEEAATRDARPPEVRWSMPLSYAKTSSQLFLGNSHFYIFVRLYHVVLMRLHAAKGMAAKAAEREAAHNGDSGKAAAAGNAAAAPPAAADATNGTAADAAALAGGSSDAVSRAALLAELRKEAGGDLYGAFLCALKQLIDGKMEASTYEDVLRSLLGTNAYVLFTLHKIISQALKQLQMLLVEETSQKLLDLYNYERGRAAPGSMAESTYRSNARMVLEGDDCFLMEQLYSAGNGETPSGALVLAFLPEKEEADEGSDGGSDDEDDEADEAGKAEAQAYMDAFILTATGARSSARARLLLARTASATPPVWEAATMRNGLECRTTAGSCKLRFVSHSEDLWFAKALANGKRAARRHGGSAAKRAKLASFADATRGRDAAANALAGLPAPTAAPLPRKHRLKAPPAAAEAEVST